MPGMNSLLSCLRLNARRHAEHIQGGPPPQQREVASALRSVNNAPAPMRPVAGETQRSSTILTGKDVLEQVHHLNQYFEGRHVMVLGSQLDFRSRLREGNCSGPFVWPSQSQQGACVLKTPDNQGFVISPNLEIISEVLRAYENKVGLIL